MRRNLMKAVTVALAAATIGAPLFASAATTVKTVPLIHAAWLPFWTTQAGQQEIALNLDKLDEISPFSYEIVDQQGTIKDDLKISSGAWDNWFSAVQSNGNKVIPTIAWFDADGIQALLSNAKTRQAEEDKIAALVKSNGFDGIDIDFEGMYPATRDYYSLFIKGLAIRLHPAKKLLTCTVVPRTPLDSLYETPPTNVTYAENYTVLSKYCDEVRLMAYDQGPIDIKLDASKGSSTLYAPVADPAWVEKVIKNALRYISPKKIVLGIPTYGYEYEVAWQSGVTTYQRVRAFDYFDAMDRADALGVQPMRNNAGELSFTFASTTYIQKSAILTSNVSPTTEPLELKATPAGMTTFFVSFPDATSEMQKVALAKKYGLRGVALFKADGQIDPAIWDDL